MKQTFILPELELSELMLWSARGRSLSSMWENAWEPARYKTRAAVARVHRPAGFEKHHINLPPTHDRRNAPRDLCPALRLCKQVSKFQKIQRTHFKSDMKYRE